MTRLLVRLLGGQRLIRDAATLCFRRAHLTEIKIAEPDEVWKDDEPKYCDSDSDVDPEEGDYARVLQLINEFLPVKELAGLLIGVPVLRQFGLVENEQVDKFLATAFGKTEPTANRVSSQPGERQQRGEAKSTQPRPVTG